MVQLKIEKLTHGGNGLGEVDGKKVFVPFSAPGDVLEIEIVKDHGSYAEGCLLEIIELAPCRVEPPCPVFGECGSCQWQHISYATQLEWKQKILKETLERIGKVENPNVLPTLPSPKEWNYRNRMMLHVDSKGRIGFYKPKSKEVVEFERCYIAEEELNNQLNARRDEIAKRDRGISLRMKHPGGDTSSCDVSPPGCEMVHFAQVNNAQNEQVKEVITEWIGKVPHETVIELYAGSGNFTFPIATVADKVITLEIDGRAVKWAREHAENEGIKNITFHRLPSDRLREVFHPPTLKLRRGSAPPKASLHKGHPDVVFLDPPRRGAAETIDAIIDLKPSIIIYMSCDPATMARDIRKLMESGWKFQKSLPVDMFPQTFHIESLTLLSIGSKIGG